MILPLYENDYRVTLCMRTNLRYFKHAVRVIYVYWYMYFLIWVSNPILE